jgi:predicted adenylyl cyclase CyaB
MKEIEVKILEIKRKNVEETLVRLGAKKVFDGDIRTLFFDFEDGKIIKAKDVLRLRKEEDKIELTYKKVRVDKAAKNAEEYSVEVSDLEMTEKILQNLGLGIIDDMLKHRVSYKLDTARYDMDRYLGKYDFIPEFLEIEAENVKAIHHYAGLLGYEPKDCLPWSTKELIEYYSKKRKKA